MNVHRPSRARINLQLLTEYSCCSCKIIINTVKIYFSPAIAIVTPTSQFAIVAP